MMIGKVRVLFLVLLLLSVAAVAQAAPLFPFTPGYTATYFCSQGANTWTAKLQVTGTTNLDGYQWWITNLINWGDEGSASLYFRVTDSALFIYGYTGGPQFQTGPPNTSWTYTDPNGPATATIVPITSVTVPAGTFSNVYEVHYVIPNNTQDEYQYWKPGVGLIKDVDYSGEYATNPQTRVLASLTPRAKTAALQFLLLSD
jgi:hypothetical protein